MRLEHAESGVLVVERDALNQSRKALRQCCGCVLHRAGIVRRKVRRGKSTIPTIGHTPQFSFDAGPIHRVNIVLVNQVPNIVSGGQTGADWAALDRAIQNGIPHGGWCPKGRRDEDEAINSRYQLKETPSTEYDQRTEWNVRDSDGIVVFLVGEVLTGGSKMTVEFDHKHDKLVLHISRSGSPAFPDVALRRFIQNHKIKVLNVAGPRASKEPEVGAFVKEVLGKTWPSEPVVRVIPSGLLILQPDDGTAATIKPGVVGDGGHRSAVGVGAFDDHYSAKQTCVPFGGE